MPSLPTPEQEQLSSTNLHLTPEQKAAIKNGEATIIGNSCSNIVGHLGDRKTEQCVYCGTRMPSGFPYKDDPFYTSQIELGDFSSEKLIENFIYKNVNVMWKEVFGEEVVLATQQKAEFVGYAMVGKDKHIPLRGVRLDLYVECTSGNKYIVEIKNPKIGQYSTMNAIGKILFYSTQYPEANKFVIISSLYEQGFIETIKKFNLPIDFVLFAKDRAYILKR